MKEIHVSTYREAGRQRVYIRIYDKDEGKHKKTIEIDVSSILKTIKEIIRNEMV